MKIKQPVVDRRPYLVEVTGAGRTMNEATTRALAASILSAPARLTEVEFRGEEPLLGLRAVELLIELLSSGLQGVAGGRQVRFTLTSSLEGLDADKLDFLGRRGVALRVFLDGPREVHDENQRSRGGADHETVTGWLRMIQQMLDAGLYPKMRPPRVVAAVTRASLGRAQAVVDEFRRLDVKDVRLEPAGSFLWARRGGDKVGITAEEFSGFYRQAFERMLELCRHHPVIREEGAASLLPATLAHPEVPLRPAQDAAPLAYDVDGRVHPVEETGPGSRVLFDLLLKKNHDPRVSAIFQRWAAMP